MNCVANCCAAVGSFLLRVWAGNIRLLRKLGYYQRERGDPVYLWPQKRQKVGKQKPLVLRLIRLGQGKKTMYLVTNVMDQKQLTKGQAKKLYQRRSWGEEVFYRSYKQTLQRRKLLSRTAATCMVESQWTLLGLWVLGLMTVSRIIAETQGSRKPHLLRSRVTSCVRPPPRGANVRDAEKDSLLKNCWPKR